MKNKKFAFMALVAIIGTVGLFALLTACDDGKDKDPPPNTDPILVGTVDGIPVYRVDGVSVAEAETAMAVLEEAYNDETWANKNFNDLVSDAIKSITVVGTGTVGTTKDTEGKYTLSVPATATKANVQTAFDTILEPFSPQMLDNGIGKAWKDADVPVADFTTIVDVFNGTIIIAYPTAKIKNVHVTKVGSGISHQGDTLHVGCNTTMEALGQYLSTNNLLSP